MESWIDEVRKAAEAGEREFGLLDAHQTIKHNLERRCAEILFDLDEPSPEDEHAGILAEGDYS